MNKANRSLALLLLMVAMPSGDAETSGASSPIAHEAPDPNGPGDPWLDAVRAQRRAWEECRRAAREAMDIHRRHRNPWPDAQTEARHQEQERRHEAFMEFIARDREYFLGQLPWQAPVPPEPPHPEATPDLGNPAETALSHPHLPGWDNRWYFRGY
jgi:hypothetical protein